MKKRLLRGLLLSMLPAPVRKLWEIIRKNMAHDHLSEEEALKAFYSSAAGASFADDTTGLYAQTPNYIFGLYLEEKMAQVISMRAD